MASIGSLESSTVGYQGWTTHLAAVAKDIQDHLSSKGHKISSFLFGRGLSADRLIYVIKRQCARATLSQKIIYHLIDRQSNGTGWFISSADAFAIPSNERGVAARDSGAFAWEIVLIEVPVGREKHLYLLRKMKAWIR
uniref:Uncharacterized protein n=1 Tax=Zea mays TaxID=4577 RepID=A0A804R3M7_MAIZE